MRPGAATIWGFGAVIAIAISLPHLPSIERLDYLALDWQFQLLRQWRERPLSPDVVIVGIDDDTFAALPEPIAMWQPHWGRLFRALAAGGPSVVGLDIVLPDRSFEALLPGYDQELLRGLTSLKARAPVVIGKTIDAHGQLRRISPYILVAARQCDGPIPIGLVITELDPDRVARRHESVRRTPEGELYTLAQQMARHLGKSSDAGLIDYSLGSPFTYESMSDVIALHESGNNAELSRLFSGKPVLVGLTLPYEDILETPVRLAAWQPHRRDVPGVLVHAQALRSLMTTGMLDSVAPINVTLVTALLSLFWWLGDRPRWSITLGVLALAFVWGMSFIRLTNGTYLPATAMTIVVLIALLGRMAMESVFAYWERQWLRNSFGSYVSPGVMRAILSGRITPSMEGERTPICVLFSDVRNFTTLSESRSPEAVISLLNAYFDQMVESVHTHQGTVDKFIGDGLMCFFGAPERLDNPCQAAFDTARDMLVRLENLNLDLAASGVEPIAIGVGLHYGAAVVGHVGSAARHEYTAIGDTVNVASRLEGLTKELGYAVICSDIVAEALGPEAGLESLGPRAVKGRAPVTVFGWPAD